jgi:streptogramin lyase
MLILEIHPMSRLSQLFRFGAGAPRSAQTRRKAVDRHRRVAVEALEGRQLMAASITEFNVPTPASTPFDITTGSDGNLWFTERGANKIGRITTAGVVTGEFSIPTASSFPVGITSGPDGNVWFVEQNGDKVGRITPSGTITEFAIPTAGSMPRDITTGPDGNLWFTESASNKIGRITPGGTITEFAVPTLNTGPRDITTGPDGNLWFTQQTSNQIGRITTTGVVTGEFSVPTPTSTPRGIVAGPDGNLWFTERNGHKIGRITTAGVLTEFALPTAGGPFDIGAGSDGNLWFTEEAGNKIGQITTAGVITEIATPTTPSAPFGITSGPDGNLWFAESVGNKIGVVELPVVVTGALSPASDSGASHSDNVTNVNLPTFTGTTKPMATVEVFVQRSDQSSPVMIGMATAGASGAWSVTAATPLADGSYTVTAMATDHFGTTSTMTPLTTTSNPLVIDTVGPQVTALTYNAGAGLITLTVQDDRGGLDHASLTNLANYMVFGPRARVGGPLGIASVTATPSGGQSETVQIQLSNFSGLRRRPFVLAVASGGVADRAGNALDGEFHGTFPSGNGHPGGMFVTMVPLPRRRHHH